MTRVNPDVVVRTPQVPEKIGVGEGIRTPDSQDRTSLAITVS